MPADAGGGVSGGSKKRRSTQISFDSDDDDDDSGAAARISDRASGSSRAGAGGSPGFGGSVGIGCGGIGCGGCGGGGGGGGGGGSSGGARSSDDDGGDSGRLLNGREMLRVAATQLLLCACPCEASVKMVDAAVSADTHSHEVYILLGFALSHLLRRVARAQLRAVARRQRGAE